MTSKKLDHNTAGSGSDAEARSMEPSERIKALAAFANTIEVDFNMPIRRFVAPD